jgi:hypothetical protein
MAATVIKGRYTCLCTACGKWIRGGDLVEYDPARKGVRHPPGECATAYPSLPPGTLTRSTDPVEQWAEIERLGRLLEAQAWTVARTMPDVPHEWSLRPKRRKQYPCRWTSEEEFDSVLLGIRRWGLRRKWRTTTFTKLDINDRYYWTCAPLQAPPQNTDLINRAVRATYEPPPLPYLSDPDPVTLPVSCVGRTVLDIGGGAPAAWREAASYLAIGAQADVARVQAAGVPHAGTLDTLLGSFVPRDPWRFDVVLALSGVAERLTEAEVVRLPLLAAPGGVVVAMFRRDAPLPESLAWSEVVAAGPWWMTVMRLT